MSLQLHTQIIRKETFEKDIKEFISQFDADLSGSNGLDYTVAEAIDNGFNSSIEYFIHEALDKHGKDLKSAISYIFNDVESTYENDEFIGAETSIHQIEDGFLVTFAYAQDQ